VAAYARKTFVLVAIAIALRVFPTVYSLVIWAVPDLLPWLLLPWRLS
jgi:hypothetical protein